MSLLSKLLGGKKPTLSDVVELLQGKEQKPASRPAGTGSAPSPHSTGSHFAQASRQETGEETPIGRSWGERMPNEPNQYNYPGTYWDYFADIFNREFAAYRVEVRKNPRSTAIRSYHFSNPDGAPALVVELLSQGCDANQLRRDCRRQGVPYLRFYYDHEGWWNARSYVVRRINEALGR